MYRQHTMRDSAKFIGVISVMVATVIPVSAQQPTSPLAAAPAQSRYPDGSKLQAQYSSVNQQVALPQGPARVRAASAASPPLHPFKPICPKA